MKRRSELTIWTLTDICPMNLRLTGSIRSITQSTVGYKYKILNFRKRYTVVLHLNNSYSVFFTEKNDYLLRCCRFTGDTATFSKSVPLFEVHLRIGATGIPRGRCMVSTYKFPNLLVILCNYWSKWEQVLIKGYVSTHYLIAFYFKIFEYLV